MSTDTGIDLVSYSPQLKDAITIQVKTNLRPKPGGGKGKLALDWWIPEDSPADLVALADLETEKVWLFLQDELAKHAQQKSSGRFHLYMYTDPSAKPKTGRLSHSYEFERFMISNRVGDLFGLSERKSGRVAKINNPRAL
jgi:hypothetical protein